MYTYKVTETMNTAGGTFMEMTYSAHRAVNLLSEFLSLHSRHFLSFSRWRELTNYNNIIVYLNKCFNELARLG